LVKVTGVTIRVVVYKSVRICKDETCIELTPAELKELRRLLSAHVEEERERGLIDRIAEALAPSEEEEEEEEE